MPVCILGSINLDVVQRLERLPRPGETVLSLSSSAFLGGKGANQAVACARMGAQVRFIGAVGEDGAGADLLGRLKAEGIEVSAVKALPGQPTGAAYICVAADGENMIVVASGANAALGPGDVAAKALEGCGVRLAQLETPLSAVEAFLRAPGEALKVLNGAPAAPEARPLLALADLVVVNETELALFAGLDAVPEGPQACAEAAEGLRAAHQSVVVTLGAAGAVAVTPGGVIAVPGRRAAKVVDTTGAGDCFCGVLAAALAEGQGLEAALGTANAAAALSVERPGAAASMPARAEVEAAGRIDGSRLRGNDAPSRE